MAKPRLIDQTRNVLRVFHYSIRTEENYIQWIKRVIFFHNKRHPKDMGEKEIRSFLTHLAVDKHVSASTQNQALSAILSLYKRVLELDLDWIDNVVRAKRPKRLPVVLSKGEVNAILNARTGRVGRHHLYEQNIGRAIKSAARKVGVEKRVSSHAMRHSFATHLLESGYDIRTLQELPGHKDVSMTMIYTHVLNKGGRGVKSPLDV